MDYLTHNFSLKVMVLLICSYHINVLISHARLASSCAFLSFSEFQVYARSHFQSISFFPLVSVMILDTFGTKGTFGTKLSTKLRNINHINHRHGFPLKLFV